MKKKKHVDANPSTWRERAVALGWERDAHRKRELDAFESGLPHDVVAVLVERNKLTAWYRVQWTIVTTQVYLLKTSVRYIPPAYSSQADTIEEERRWCPAHAFACGATKALWCGYNCDRTKECCCGSCLNSALAKEPFEKRMNLTRWPQPRNSKRKVETVVIARPARRPKKIAAPKKPRKPKDHLLPGQIGLLPQPR